MRICLAALTLLLLVGCSGEGDRDGNLFDSSVKPHAPSSFYQPSLSATWQWQLNREVNTLYDVEVYDIDLFDASHELIESLHESGKYVICYFSAGSYESWRVDESDFPPSALGYAMDGWIGEKWLDIRATSLAPVMRARLDLAVEKGCDGVEPDNMDGYINRTGFYLNADEQLAYNKFIANEARMRGLSVGLKNDLDQVVELEPYFDFAVSEQCHAHRKCELLKPFIDASKPVFNAEYAERYVYNLNGARDTMCEDSINLKFKTLVLPMGLDDSFRDSCD